MKFALQVLLTEIIKELGIKDVVVLVERPADMSRGDYTTNVAMVLAKRLKRRPIEIAEKIIKQLAVGSSQFAVKERDHSTDRSGQKVSGFAGKIGALQDIEKIEVVPPGFINFHFSASSLSTELVEVLEEKESFGTRKSKQIADSSSQLGAEKSQKGKIERQKLPTANYSLPTRIMVEFAHPNTHKAFHIGHVRNISTGETIVRLLESQGTQVIRANYQGDVGMHIAKCIYGILQSKNNYEEIKNQDVFKKVEFLGQMYAKGNKAFAEDETAKNKIGEINIQIYTKDPKILPLYLETRQWSLDYFEKVYKRVGSHFDRYYFEGEVYENGKTNVLAGLKKGIFTESQGAIIFPGEKFGLHNRVFITQEGNATYEGKDMGLGPLQFAEYNPDLIIHVVGPEQAGYFQVVFEALAQLFPETRGKEYHLIYGWVKLKHGKMSSRSGNVVLGEWLLDEVKKEVYKILESSVSKYSKEDPSFVKTSAGEQEMIAEKTAIAAVKYSFLKVSTKQEIAFDLAESVNINGDSGPYLLYTYARCRSVMRKGEEQEGLNDKLRIKNNGDNANSHNSVFISHDSYNNEELLVMRVIRQLPEVVEEAAANYAPSLLCKYLYDLASAYNTFYNKHSILGRASVIASEAKQSQVEKIASPVSELVRNDDESITNFRLALTAATAQVLKNGLYLLGIETVERM